MTDLTFHHEPHPEIPGVVRPVMGQTVRIDHETGAVILMGEPYQTQPMPIPNTELDDEIEQILGRFLDDSIERIHARNAICAAISARGFDVYARRPQ